MDAQLGPEIGVEARSIRPSGCFPCILGRSSLEPSLSYGLILGSSSHSINTSCETVTTATKPNHLKPLGVVLMMGLDPPSRTTRIPATHRTPVGLNEFARLYGPINRVSRLDTFPTRPTIPAIGRSPGRLSLQHRRIVSDSVRPRLLPVLFCKSPATRLHVEQRAWSAPTVRPSLPPIEKI